LQGSGIFRVRPIRVFQKENSLFDVFHWGDSSRGWSKFWNLALCTNCFNSILSNHALRHTAATLDCLHTGDLRAVRELPCHSNPRMTARYAHVVDMAKKNPALLIPVKID
jgi:integrase